jgi:hypothetical protein
VNLCETPRAEPAPVDPRRWPLTRYWIATFVQDQRRQMLRFGPAKNVGNEHIREREAARRAHARLTLYLCQNYPFGSKTSDVYRRVREFREPRK